MTIDPNWTPTTVAQSFFDQPSVQALYPVGDDGTLIDALYQNLFAREADTEGRDYWLGELAVARVERNQMIIALIEGGYANYLAIPDMFWRVINQKVRIVMFTIKLYNLCFKIQTHASKSDIPQ
jgi:hypothetical protein